MSAQTEATRDSGRCERGVPVLMRRECTIFSSDVELNLCGNCVSKVPKEGIGELCKLCLFSMVKEEIVQHDIEGSAQTIAAFKWLS